MTLIADPWWLTMPLTAALLFDAAASLKPPAFIRDCLDGVRFPREWWWVLIVIKTLAATGLIVGLWVPGVGLAANIGVIVYFLCAAASHLRAKFLTQAFWLNCLGMLALSILTLVFSFFA
ncbi:DoxX family protein [Leucobacter soli]|uniref:DoxX-like family protein n=1 Tax=Leucobacter soli TaxID=2812850 RepID=A0A916JU41_9MICO|nr:DoxX family protein [Leucobacter soli]CAG7603088.1 hypothetical protein LEUCIP111803_00617 [Leucobacter soli]